MSARVVCWIAATLLVASCAPPPRPGEVPTPPFPGEPAPRPRPRAESPPPPEGEPTISVGLAWDLDSLVLDPVGGAAIESRAIASARHVGRVEARVLPSGAEVRLGGENAVRFGARDTLRVRGLDGPEDGPARFIRWNGKSWRGTMKVFLGPRGKLTLAAETGLESYLLGVIPGEIGALAEDLLEAGRAQTIAARSYTLYYRGRRGSEGFDLYGTVEDQVFGPIESERPLATRCVRSTAGQVALFGGTPIRANYSSTCGGITADVWEAWPTPPLPYLASHRDGSDESGSRHYCAASPHFRWREEWTAAEFTANLAKFGPPQGVAPPQDAVGELLDVQVAARSRSGRVWKLVVRTTTGDIAVPAYAIRWVLRRGGNPTPILRSNLFKVDVRRDPRTRRALAVVASGAGSGHGVGLCQTGALGMARAGEKGEGILEHYYPGVKLVRAY